MVKFLHTILFAIIVLFLQSCIVSSKASKFDFAKETDFGDQAKVISVNVPTFLAKAYIKKELKKDGESEEIINLIKKVKDIKILVVENAKDTSKADFQKFVDNKNFLEWISIKQDKQVVSILANQTKNDVIKRFIINVNDKKNGFVFVDVKGNFSADDMFKIISSTENNKLKIKK